MNTRLPFSIALSVALLAGAMSGWAALAADQPAPATGQPAPAADEGARLKQLDELLLSTKYDEAEALAKTLLAEHANSARVRCAAAQVDLVRGRHEAALDGLTASIKLDFKRMEPRARKAELLDLLGRHDEATQAADAVIDFYNENAKSVTEPREMAAVGLALKLVNAPKDALRVLSLAQRADKTDPAATLELGRLFLLKGQVTDASREFNDVLRARAKHPEALIGLAQCAFSLGELDGAEKYARAALEVAPNSADADDLLAAMAAIDDDFKEAAAHVARSLAVNPNGLSAHAIRAGCCLVRGDDAGYKREEALVQKINPRCSEFYTWVGDACENKRRMTLAEKMYRTAIELDPDAYDAMASLGQHLFRAAKYAEAKKLLEESHKIDGFNVRTFNTLSLLDEMGRYKALPAGDQAVVRLSDELDGVLADYVKEHTTRSLDDLARIYGFRPAGPITVEVLPTQRYFAARCVGLPHIGAIGVCFGNVVAFTTPREQGGQVNWHETLRHELTHAVTLLGSDYRIPHWLTEGMAVHEQHSDRPYNWDVLLKTSARLGRLIPLGELTRSFTRPKSAEQRMLAYCESEVVLDFFLEKCGEKCLPDLLSAFRQGKELPDAVQAVAKMPFDAFEKECMAYVRRVAGSIPVLPAVTPADEKKILDDAAKGPDSADAQCNLAVLLFRQRKYTEARSAAEKAVKANAKCAEAHYLAARIADAQNRATDAARSALAALAADKNYAPAYFYLGENALKQNNAEQAIRYFREAIRSHPRFPNAYAALAKVYQDQKNEAEAAKVFEDLIRHTSDSFGPCLDLCRYYVKEKRWADAERVANAAIAIGPFFAEPHIVAGQAMWEQGKDEPAVKEMEAAAVCARSGLKQMEELYRRLAAPGGRKDQAAELEKKLAEARRITATNNLRLARAYLKKGNAELAKTAALAAFDLDPNNEEVQALLQRLSGVRPPEPAPHLQPQP